ncbi:MAG: hypothetical protein Q8N55_02905 [bacterium]|nr:hypothetical protein [bacterium]
MQGKNLEFFPIPPDISLDYLGVDEKGHRRRKSKNEEFSFSNGISKQEVGIKGGCLPERFDENNQQKRGALVVLPEGKFETKASSPKDAVLKVMNREHFSNARKKEILDKFLYKAYEVEGN